MAVMPKQKRASRMPSSARVANLLPAVPPNAVPNASPAATFQRTLPMRACCPSAARLGGTMATSAVPRTAAWGRAVAKERAGVTMTPPPTPNRPDANPARAPVLAMSASCWGGWSGDEKKLLSRPLVLRSRLGSSFGMFELSTTVRSTCLVFSLPTVRLLYLLMGTVGATPMRKIPSTRRKSLAPTLAVHMAPSGDVATAATATVAAAVVSRHPSLA
eukprot:scaffold2848_cov352-Pavlova_lutheri.AAC.17